MLDHYQEACEILMNCVLSNGRLCSRKGGGLHFPYPIIFYSRFNGFLKAFREYQKRDNKKNCFASIVQFNCDIT